MRTLDQFACAGMAALALCLLQADWAKADTVTVSVGDPCGDRIFIPAEVQINTGDTVCWTWVGSNHSSTSDAGLWDSGIQSSGFQFEFTFDTAGDYPYHCTPHQCFGMTGIVHVVDAPSARAFTIPIGFMGAVLGAGTLGVLGYGWRRRKQA